MAILGLKKEDNDKDYTGYDFTGHDYIMKIIEQFAAFLSAIVFYKRAQNYDIAIIKINEAYTGLLNIDPIEIKELSFQGIVERNTYGEILDKDNIEIIANLLYEEADIIERVNENIEESFNCYQKAIELFILLFDLTKNIKYCKNIEKIIIKLEKYNVENAINFKIYEYFYSIESYGKAEDKLYELLDNEYLGIDSEINNFYGKLLEKDDDNLEKGNLPRNEIIGAISELNNKK